MEELADKTAAILATRSSRRRFLRLVGTTARRWSLADAERRVACRSDGVRRL